jgi:hypothetical protein
MTVSLPATGDTSGGGDPFLGGSSAAVGASGAIKIKVQIVFEVI